MIGRSGALFSEFLAGRVRVPVLFEPFLSRRHAETLIWRRGPHLWDTPRHEIETLISVTERTGSDFVWIDLRGRESLEKRVLAAEVEHGRKLAPFLGFGFLGETREDLLLAEEICEAVCLWGDETSDKTPVIRMDGRIEDAVRRGDCGWFARSGAEDALVEADGRIRVFGGLGVDRLSSPAPLYRRVETLDASCRGEWAVGSGGVVPDEDYLGLIAMLGAYARIREDAERTLGTTAPGLFNEI